MEEGFTHFPNDLVNAHGHHSHHGHGHNLHAHHVHHSHGSNCICCDCRPHGCNFPAPPPHSVYCQAAPFTNKCHPKYHNLSTGYGMSVPYHLHPGHDLSLLHSYYDSQYYPSYYPSYY